MVDSQGLGEKLLAAGEPVVLFTLEVVDALMRTSNEQKIDALARVWAHGIGDPSSIDLETLMVKSLAQLEALHILTLETVYSGSGVLDEVKL